MDFLPLFFDIKQKPCLVVGGGEVAARKAALLLKAQATVTVVSPTLERELTDMLAEGKFTHVEREFEDSDINQQALVFAATNTQSRGHL